MVTWVTFPAGATAGQAGIVFGYKGVSDYYVRVIDLGAQQVRDYHVVDGSKTLLSTSGYGIAAGQKKVVRIDFTPTHGGWLPFTNFSDGFPSGRVGLFSNVAHVKYDAVEVSAPPGASGGASSAALRLASSAEESSDTFNAIKPDVDRLRGGFHLVKGVRATKFRATFSETVDSGNEAFALLFDAHDRHHYKEVRFGTTGGAPSVRVWDGGDGVTQTATTNAAAMPSATQGQTLWFRVESDGTTLTAKSIQSTTAPGDAAWSAASAGLTTSSVDITGGQLGLKNISWWALLDDLTLQTDRDADGSFETTEHVERFTADANGFVQDTLEYDAAGNLTYDGVFRYTYDAWNRQTKVTKAYRDDNGVLQLGSVVQENEYDGVGRRIVVEVKNSGDLDHTEHIFYDGWSQVETRNGSGIVTRQMTWAGRVGGYIDELLQIAHNLDWPDALPAADQNCEAKYWAMQDANYNVLGIVDDEGKLVERYEYTPYGERTVSSPGSLHHMLNPFGVQGLESDAVTGLIVNRARIRHNSMAQFLQRDPAQYTDGLRLYSLLGSNPTRYSDPDGELIGILVVGAIVTVGIIITYEGARSWDTDALSRDQAGYVARLIRGMKHCAAHCKANTPSKAVPIYLDKLSVAGINEAGAYQMESDSDAITTPKLGGVGNRTFLSHTFFRRSLTEQMLELLHESYHAEKEDFNVQPDGGYTYEAKAFEAVTAGCTLEAIRDYMRKGDR